jgi:hypothetical protein
MASFQFNAKLRTLDYTIRYLSGSEQKGRRGRLLFRNGDDQTPVLCIADRSDSLHLRAALAVGTGSPKRVLIVEPDKRVRLRYQTLLGSQVKMTRKTFEEFCPSLL